MTDPVLLVISPVPPPQGGIATWTSRVIDTGVPGWEVRVIDTRIRSRRILFDETNVHQEVWRTLVIVLSLVRALINRPQVVHLNSALSPAGVIRDIVCLLLSRLRGCPVITQYHGELSYFRHDALGGISGAALRSLARLSTRNFVLSASAVPELEVIVGRANMRHCAAVIPTFVADDWPAQLAPQTSRPRVRVLYVGGLTLQKGTCELLEVAARCPDIEFALVGNSTRDVRHALAAAPPNCVLRGAVPIREVAAEFGASDIFFLPSWTEGCPTVVLEAMGASLPVVATNVGAIPDLLRNGEGGFIHEPRDIEGFIRSIQELAANPALRASIGQRNRQVCDEQYRATPVIARMAKVYVDVMSEEHRANPFRPSFDGIMREVLYRQRQHSARRKARNGDQVSAALAVRRGDSAQP